MKLLTKEISSKIPNLYEQEGKGENAVVYIKFFLPGTRWTWYAAEFNGEDTFFGWVKSGISPDFDELGYFSLSELKEVNVERDLYFEPKPLKEIIKNNKFAIEFIYTKEIQTIYKCYESRYEKNYTKILFPLPDFRAIFGPSEYEFEEYQAGPLYISIQPESEKLIEIIEEEFGSK